MRLQSRTSYQKKKKKSNYESYQNQRVCIEVHISHITAGLDHEGSLWSENNEIYVAPNWPRLALLADIYLTHIFRFCGN